MEQDVDIAHSQPTAPPRRRAPPSVSEGAQLHRLVLRRAMGEIVTSCHDTHIFHRGLALVHWRLWPRREESRTRGDRTASCLRVSAWACAGNCRAPYMELLLPFHSGILAACMCIADGPPPPSTGGLQRMLAYTFPCARRITVPRFWRSLHRSRHLHGCSASPMSSAAGRSDPMQ